MFNLKGRDHLAEPNGPGKAALKPALYDPPGSLVKPGAAIAPRPPAAPSIPTHDGHPVAAVTTRGDDTRAAASAPAIPLTAPRPSEPAPSKLFVGNNIKLKGVEISDCDVLVIEGHVEATVHSQAMQIAKPGTLQGTALIDVAEIDGEFSGELTARTRLVVHGTGRVRGVIRYGQLIVEEGGEISGDVKRLEAPERQANPSRVPPGEARRLPEPAPGTVSR